MKKLNDHLPNNRKIPFYKPTLKTGNVKCQFDGCDVIFKGIVSGCSQSKYCPEHRKPKYRKLIDKDKIKVKKKITVNEDTSNQTIKHSYKLATIVIGKCQLSGCGKDFDILLVPNCYTYSRYCEEHRNKFKRERHILNGKTC